MTIQECYHALEGDYAEVLCRLYREELVKKFTAMFLSDKSFKLLEDSMASENFEEAFRAAHTLKGVCQNLSFTKLFHSSHEITEALRMKDFDHARALLPRVEMDYAQTFSAVQAFHKG